MYVMVFCRCYLLYLYDFNLKILAEFSFLNLLEMGDRNEDNTNDSRPLCRYGNECYQKNPTHHQKFKHLSQTIKRKNNHEHTGIDSKKIKIEAPSSLCELQVNNEIENPKTTEQESTSTATKVNNDVSTSESEEESQGEPNHIISNVNGKSMAEDFIKEKFLMEMPQDFYQFYKFCENINKSNPSDALAGIGFQLVGPYDVLNGKFENVQKEPEQYLLHWRYFHDPPQMQTVLKGDNKEGYHIGYFRDAPNEKPVFLVKNSASKNGILECMGENIFAAVSIYLENKMKSVSPFEKMKFSKLAGQIKREAEKLQIQLNVKTNNIDKRNKKIVTRSFNKIGLVVPYDRKTQLGYRKLAMSDKKLWDLLTDIQEAESTQKSKLLSELQSELLTWTDIACDECDFGTGIELGWNIIAHGIEDLNFTASRFLATNFRQLKWEAFAKIAEAHMVNRKKGCDLSIL